MRSEDMFTVQHSEQQPLRGLHQHCLSISDFDIITVISHTTRSLQLTAESLNPLSVMGSREPHQAGPAYRTRLMVVAFVTWYIEWITWEAMSDRYFDGVVVNILDCRLKGLWLKSLSGQKCLSRLRFQQSSIAQFNYYEYIVGEKTRLQRRALATCAHSLFRY